MSGNELVVARPQQMQQSSVFINMEAFENSQRMARVLADSQLVPDIFRGKIADCVIALELAMRIGASPMAVLQNTYIVHGKPGYSAQFIIAMINSCGRYSPLRFDITGKDQKKSCFAWAIENATGERLEGPPCSIEIAKAEGWYQKKGSKWQTMPDLMLRYRAATFFGRLYAPELLMGMSSTEELYDTETRKPKNIGQTDSSCEKLNLTFKAAPEPKEPVKEKSPKKEPVEVEVPPEVVGPEPTPPEIEPIDTPPVSDQKQVDKLIAAVAMIQSLKDLERWIQSSQEILDKNLTLDADKDQVNAFINEHHLALTEREFVKAEDFMGHIEGYEVAPHDPNIPYAHFQREARRQKTTMQLDKWRLAKHQEFDKVMSDAELAVFVGWVQALYDHWTACEA